MFIAVKVDINPDPGKLPGGSQIQSDASTVSAPGRSSRRSADC